MSKAIINGQEFEARSYVPFFYDNGNMTATFYVYSDSIDEIVNLVGDKATIEIPNEFLAHDMRLTRILRYYDNGDSTCEVEFMPFDLRKTVQNNVDDIELVSQAVTELASIVGE